MNNPFVKILPIERIDGGIHSVCEDLVIVEQKVSFYLNSCKLLSVMTLPCDQDAHFVGFLISEGVIESLEDVESIEVSKDGLAVYLQARIQEHALKHLFSDKTLTSGCCVGVSGNIDTQDSSSPVLKKFVSTPLAVPFSFIMEQITDFEKPTALFSQTGCVHKALLHLRDHKIYSEDIGRHSAIDKVMGKAYLQHLSTQEGILFVSGRLSSEMVIKAVMHQIPIIVSKAAATFQGIKIAQELGITLIGFARGNTCNIYTHAGRIKLSKK